MLVELLSINNHFLLAFFVQTYQDMRCVDVSGIQGMVLNMLKHDNEVYFQAFTMEKPSGERICKF